MNKVHREPNFENILKVLRREKPDRPTLFEFFMNGNVYREAVGPGPQGDSLLESTAYMAKAYAACGYDYVNSYGCRFAFNPTEQERKNTISLNGHVCINSWEAFEKFRWPQIGSFDFSMLKKIEPFLPGNMKIMLSGPGGVLENVIDLVGYDNLCMLLYDDPELAAAVFEKVGSVLAEYYEIGAQYDSVGIIMSNDDWGFKNQTMLSPEDMRKYVFPWHKRIVEAAHKNGKPAVLHSCGNLEPVMEDIITDMKFDGKHSFEDVIMPVEEAYRRWGGRIAILGGIDVDFLIRSEPEEIVRRSRDMLELARAKGGYALGSGNSIPEYIPNEKYFAMTSAVAE